MPPGDAYRAKAAELFGKSATEANAEARAELETLALSYLRLADQADRNSTTDIVYVTPGPAIPPEQTPLSEDSGEA
jgi:hypothetical protein